MTELAGLAVGVVLFSWLHNLAGTDIATATANADALQSVERALHLDIEVAANHWLAGHSALVQAAVLYYRLYYLPLVAITTGNHYVLDVAGSAVLLTISIGVAAAWDRCRRNQIS